MGASHSRRHRVHPTFPARSLSATLLLSVCDESRAYFRLSDDSNSRKIHLNDYGQIDKFYVSQLLCGDPGEGEWLCSTSSQKEFFNRLVEVAELPIRNLYLHNIDLGVFTLGNYEEARCALKSVGSTVKNLYIDGVYGCQRELRELMINAIASEEIVGLQMTNVDLEEDMPQLILKWIERGSWRHVEILQVTGCQFTTTFLEAVLACWDRCGGFRGSPRRMLIDLRLTSTEDLSAFQGTHSKRRIGSGSKAVIRRHGWERFELELS